jgi:hypothetical protein
MPILRLGAHGDWEERRHSGERSHRSETGRCRRPEDGFGPSIRESGVGDGEITEIVAHVALNVYTNYFNNVAHTEVDFPKVELLGV